MHDYKMLNGVVMDQRGDYGPQMKQSFLSGQWIWFGLIFSDPEVECISRDQISRSSVI